MTLTKEMTRRAYYNSGDTGVRVIPGDDITKAAWRFEKKILEMPIEKSEGWRTFALLNNILDPFQIASSEEIQYAAPSDPVVIHSNGLMATTVDLSEYEELTIFRLDLYNNYGGTPIFIGSEHIQLGVDAGHVGENINAAIRREGLEIFLDIVINDPLISYIFTVDLIVFRPREMSIATGQIVSAGNVFESKNYPASGNTYGR